MKNAKITFAGDFAPAMLIGDIELDIGHDLKKIISKSDHFFINLEAPITSSKIKRIKAGNAFKIMDSHAKLLMELKVSGVSLANNHMFDFGEIGVKDTVEFLNRNSISFWGIGSDKYKAWNPFIFEENGIKIGILSYAEHEFNWISDDKYCTSMIEPATNVLQIIELKKQVDHVIVYTHIGPENWHYPSPRQVSLFHNFIDAGASAVLNCHSHTIMGMTWYKNKPIYYSLGNFYFPFENTKESWFEGLLVELNFIKGEELVSVKENFIQFSKHKISLLEVSGTTFKNYDKLSERIEDNNYIKEKWDEFSQQERKKLFSEVIKAVSAIIIGWFLGLFFNKFKTIYYKGLAILRDYSLCENHIENIGNIFNMMLKHKLK